MQKESPLHPKERKEETKVPSCFFIRVSYTIKCNIKKKIEVHTNLR